MAILVETSGPVTGLVTSPVFWTGAAIVYWVLSTLLAWYRLRHFKGPWLASLSSLYMLRSSTSGRNDDIYYKVNQKYGNIARIGPNDLLTGDPAIIRRMSAARSTYSRSDWYKAGLFHPRLDNLFSMTDTREHDELKAKTAHGYDGKEVPRMEDDVDTQLVAFVHLIRDHARAGGKIDMATASSYFTLDVITKIAYGKEFGYLKSNSDVHDYLKATQKQMALVTACGEVLWLQNVFMNRLFVRLFGPKYTDKAGVGKLMHLSRALVTERFRDGAEDRNDMLGSFIRHGVGMDQCEGEIPLQILAGSDTTAHAIRMTLLYVVSSPRVYRRLQSEIDEAVARGAISSPVKAAEGRQMDYLQGVIYEGIRLSLPAAALLMKTVPPQGDTLDGRFVPGGTRIGHAVKTLMRWKPTFGEDADVFRPERWLGLPHARKREMMDTADLVFGFGRWGCAGKPVAMLELEKTFVELLRHFDFQVVDPLAPVEISETLQIHFQTGMWMMVKERETLK